MIQKKNSLKLRSFSKRVAQEGIVILENNNNILPIIEKKVALFGRIQTNYYKSGTGSGGLVNVTDVPSLIEAAYVRIYQKDYDYYDKEKPESPYRLTESTKKDNSIMWDVPYDDMGVEYYNVYVDGEYYFNTNLPQITLRTLEKGKTYSISVEAIDFTGKVSNMSESLLFTASFLI